MWLKLHQLVVACLLPAICNHTIALAVEPAGGKGEPSPVTVAKNIEDYVAAFPNVHCEYRIRVGNAPTIEAALKDGPIGHARLVAKSRWVRRGGDELIEVPIHQAAASVSGMQTGASDPSPGPVVLPLSILTNGKLLLFVDNGSHHGTICPPGQAAGDMPITPFSLLSLVGKASLPSRLRTPRPDEKSTVELGKSHEVHVSCSLTAGTWVERFDYTLEPKLNFLPREQEFGYEGMKPSFSRTVVTGTRDCSGGRVFPTRIVEVRPVVIAVRRGNVVTQTGKTGFDVTELLVDTLDVDGVPDDSAFSLVLPRDTQVYDNLNPKTAFVTPVDQAVGLKDLGDLYGQTQIESGEDLGSARARR